MRPPFVLRLTVAPLFMDELITVSRSAGIRMIEYLCTQSVVVKLVRLLAMLFLSVMIMLLSARLVLVTVLR